MANGTVKWFNQTKGFGFIAPESGGRDIFVHISAMERGGIAQLDDGQSVTFDVEAGRDGRESRPIWHSPDLTGFGPGGHCRVPQPRRLHAP